MTTTVKVVLGTSDTNAAVQTGRALLSSGAVSFRFRVARHLPPSIDAGQAYYWSRTWQRDQDEVLGELDSDDRVEFGRADDAIRWLLSADE